MKVIVNAISARMGGIVTYTRNLIDSFAARHQDAIFSVAPNFPEVEQPVHREPASFYRPLRRFAWEQTFWRQRVARSGADLLFSSANFGLLNSPIPQMLLIREGGLFDPDYLSNVAPAQGAKASILRTLRRSLMLRSARHADQVITPSATIRDLMVGWAPDLAERITVNHYGTVNNAFRPADDASRAWRATGQLRLLYVSVYYPHKQPGTICQALDIARKRGLPTRATITMDLRELGDFTGSALDSILMEKAAADGLIDLGRRPYHELPALYRGHDVFVFPSLSETFGHPMVEAMSSGIPVVAADTAINREICGESALYFPPTSPSGLVECLERLDSDPGLRQALSVSGRRRVLDCFTWDAHVDRLINIFHSLHARKTGRAA